MRAILALGRSAHWVDQREILILPRTCEKLGNNSHRLVTILMRIELTPGKLALAVVGLLLVLFTQAPSQQLAAGKSAEGASDGQQVFSSICAGCHGLDGAGTQRAPNIVSNAQIQKLSPAELTHIISEGVPGAGMPAFNSLGKPTIDSIVAYIRELQGKNSDIALRGNPQKGEALFFGAAQCSDCHTVNGKGGFLGPDLSAYIQDHTAEQMKTAITDPAARGPIRYQVTAVASDGKRYEGVIRNEDNFSLQLLSKDGTFYFLPKAKLGKIERGPDLMPSDYSSRLSGPEIDDIVSFVLSGAKPSRPTPAHGEDED
jgi:cytochrome c oxidase cbb3-type subunit 3